MMTPGQKAAAILALAGEENASKLVQNIPEYEVKKILRSFHRLPTLSEQDIDNIAKEFLEIIKYLNSDNNKFSFDNAKRILYAANNSIKDKNWIESISDSFLIDEIRRLLNDIDEKMLANWLKNEHPQTMSLVLSICLPEKSSSLFKSLQEHLRCELILRISQMNHVNTPELENLYEELEKLQKNRISIQSSPGGFEKILSVLQAAPYEQRKKLLEGIEIKDPELTKKLIHALLSVSRLADLEPNHLAMLCSNLSDKMISLAMKLEKPEIKEKYLSAISKKRRHLIEEDIEGSKELKKTADIAASLIVKKALELRDSGKIVFPWEVTLV
jgi:flagellar motor switch protein FliG